MDESGTLQHVLEAYCVMDAAGIPVIMIHCSTDGFHACMHFASPSSPGLNFTQAFANPFIR